MSTAKAVKAQGATFLRGGAFKPRTSPYEFQGLAEPGLKLLAQAAKEYDLGIVTEVLSERDVELVASYADILQIGARNAQNFSLITEAARSGKTILLKRGMTMRIEEWLLAAEYVLGTLDKEEREQAQALIASDPDFAALTGDWHPQHADAHWAATSAFGERIAHGIIIRGWRQG